MVMFALGIAFRFASLRIPVIVDLLPTSDLFSASNVICELIFSTINDDLLVLLR